VEWLRSVEHYFGIQPIGHAGNQFTTDASPVSREATLWHWRDEVPVEHLPPGKALAIEDRVPFILHLGFDGWLRTEDRRAEPTPFGLWSVLLTHQELAEAAELNFTRCHDGRWESEDHRVALDPNVRAGPLAHVRSPEHAESPRQ
jgi:hypothetical protein